MNIREMNKRDLCPGCGCTLGKKEHSRAGYIFEKSVQRKNRLEDKEGRYAAGGGRAWYCGKCASDLDCWYKVCACCGKKVPGGQPVKLMGKYYCRECAEKPEITEPLTVSGMNIYFNSAWYFRWREENPRKELEFKAALPLTEREPVLTLFEDGIQTARYVLETEGDDEDHTGKFFHISVRVNTMPTSGIISIQTDGYVSPDENSEKFSCNDIGYRMEGRIANCSGLPGLVARTALQGRGLAEKALRYPGYITPGNVRLIGQCTKCGKSLVFRSINYPMMGGIPCYSEDGKELCGMYDRLSKEETENWTHESGGHTFTWKNPFRCRFCGEPYIDYPVRTKKAYGLYGCLYLGHKTFE